MIRGMNVLHGLKFSTPSILVCALGLIGSAAPAVGATRTGYLPKSCALRVRLYGCPELTPWVVWSAEKEAARMLEGLHVPLDWLNCTAKTHSSGCFSPESQDEVVVRILSKAPLQASHTALGAACSKTTIAAAFIYYDRVTALRGEERLIPVILGRVLAHEITHLLLPVEPHSEAGLMRETWYTDDLRAASVACVGLSSASIKLMRKEIDRRALKIGTNCKEAMR